MTYDSVVNILSMLNKIWKIVNNGNEIENQKYFHYTDINGFLGILSPMINENKDECILYAGNIRYMNDFKEYRYGIECLEKVASEGKISNEIRDNLKIANEKIRNDNSAYSKIYSISFCGNDDLLSQWKYYGRNSGIAIEFDLKNSEWYWSDMCPKDAYIKVPPIRVIYNDHIRILSDFFEKYSLESTVKNSLEYVAKALVPICKDKYFSEEMETRTILWPIEDDTIGTKIKYRTTRDLIMPYFDCHVKSAIEGQPVIKSIVVGPGIEQERIFNSIIQILEIKNNNKDTYKYFETETIKDIHNCNNGKPAFSANANELFLCEEGDKKRIAYKTTNGIIVKMSESPFRG